MSRSIPAKHSVTVTDSERGLRDTENGKLIFTEYRGRHCALLLRNGRLTAASFLPDDAESAVGSVYIGKIKNMAKNIDACFVEIEEGRICFLPLKKAVSPFLTNRAYDGRLLEGDELLVQVERDAQKNKQISVTAQISLANDYFALALGTTRFGFSSRLDRKKKEALTALLTEKAVLCQGSLTQEPAGLLNDLQELEALKRSGLRLPPVGAIARTRLEELTDSREIMNAFFDLTKKLSQLLRSALTRECCTCLLQAPPPWEAALHNLAFPGEYSEIVTDSPKRYQELAAYCAEHLPDKELRLYEDTAFSLAKLYSLETRMEAALRSKVWLRSGGYLVIEPTEALTVIDVNSGKNENGKAAAEAQRALNHEAAEEIALQLRLRNLSGIILVDFINMAGEENGKQLLAHLRELVRADRVRTTVVDITPLGLVEITRKKVNPPLAEQFQEKEINGKKHGMPWTREST